ncbi:MAG: hypothetical protein AAGD96_26125 [Chloroflexota bacterium]
MNLLIGSFLAVCTTTFFALIILRMIANRRGVQRVQPYSFKDASVEHLFFQADYVDAYRAPLRSSSLQDIDTVVYKAFQKGNEISRTGSEVIFQEGAPGLDFAVSYRLEPDDEPRTLTMTTAVLFKGTKGKRYFRFVCPVHCTLTPFMISRMAN